MDDNTEFEIDEDLVSINEIKERYEQEDIEISADYDAKVNLAIYHEENDDGSLGETTVMASFIVDDDYLTFGFLHPPDETEGWTPEGLAKLLKIDPNARIWQVEKRIDQEAVAEMFNRATSDDEDG